VHFAMPQYHICHEPLCVYVGLFCVSVEHSPTIRFFSNSTPEDDTSINFPCNKMHGSHKNIGCH
jgi:hypothetical protein